MCGRDQGSVERTLGSHLGLSRRIFCVGLRFVKSGGTNTWGTKSFGGEDPESWFESGPEKKR